MAEEFPTYNGNAVSWFDISCRTAPYETGSPLKLYGVKDISWKMAVERGMQKGYGGYVINRSRGGRTYEASLTLYKSGLKSLIRQLVPIAQSLGHVRGNTVVIGNVAFEFLVMHTPLGTSEIDQVKIKGCMLDELGQSLAEGNDVDTASITFNTVGIAMIDNGVEVQL